MTPERAGQILQLGRPWTATAIKKAYKKQAKTAHPDKPGGSEAAFNEVARARAVLDDYLERLAKTGSGDASESRDWDAWAPPEEWETEEEPADEKPLSAWFEVLSVRVEGHPRIAVAFRNAQLVELEKKTLNKFGEAIERHFLIGITPVSPIELPGQLVEVVLREKGDTTSAPSVFVRKIVQRSHDKKNRVTAFWIDPLAEPVVSEVNTSDFSYEAQGVGVDRGPSPVHDHWRPGESFDGSDFWP